MHNKLTRKIRKAADANTLALAELRRMDHVVISDDLNRATTFVTDAEQELLDLLEFADTVDELQREFHDTIAALVLCEEAIDGD